MNVSDPRDAVMLEPRFKNLAQEMRCVVCQNQSLAESSSGLAKDLRIQIADQILAGKSDAEITAYMVDRYGEFVLYNPPMNLTNAPLWIGPSVLFAVAVAVVWKIIRKHRDTPEPPEGST